MRIEKKRIRSVEANFIGVAPGARVFAAVPVDEVPAARLRKAGFTPDAKPGEKVLPSVVGPVSRFNAEGRLLVHRDQEMETCYRQREWTYFQWHGKDKVEVTDIVDVPYRRYPRTPVPPPSVELQVIELADGRRAVATPAAVVDVQRGERLLLHVNLMLELFGVCDVLDERLRPAGVLSTMRLNWRVLPPGRQPWERLKPLLQNVVDVQKAGNRPVVEHRLETVNGYGPEFTAVGNGGFAGYVIFGFPARSLFVLECTRYGNATYVLERDWESLSKLTKAELLDAKLHKARLIHVQHWEARLADLFRLVKKAV
ncbi:MAG: hypothetical protein MUF27_01655 [Acidobacteria bacterium]|jgi:hypothetical protein|nr:hypothetical protein [Acidobacteriota bacterium]